MKKTYLKIAAASLLAALVVPAAMGDSNDANSASVARNLDIFNNIYKELTTFYVDTIDAKKSIETAINAMLDDIDPYTEYIPASEQDEFRVLATGEYGGIGSYIMNRTGDKKGVYISSPYKGSPAAKAGLRPGDRIIMIDGDSVVNWSSDSVSSHLKGQPNTHVHLKVERQWTQDSIIDFDITRETIKVDPVPYHGVARGCMGYISLTTFNEQSAQQVKDAVVELKQNPDVKFLVLDLRGNGGGLMESAIQIVGHFVPKGTQVLVTRGRDKQSEKTYKTTADPVDTTTPLVVLVDGSSASSSEITAGALQDLDRAVIVGSRSFGKGLVQSTRPLPFDGLLKVTVAKYYIPSGRLIQEVDYSHRNPDGTFQRKPDSLANVFHTANGREVRDGGGITPDIKVEYPEINRLVYNIVRDHWAFDFATKYAAEHPSIPSPAKFEVTDEIFNEFKAFINPDKFEYDKVCEAGLKALKDVAKAEGYMNDSTSIEFERLEKLLKHDLSHDLDTHRSEIAKHLAQEILDRYYFQQGQLEYMVRKDEAIDRTLEMFAKPGEYERILGKPVTEGKPAKSNKKKR
ncbi:S41 family peptidase [Sodaliphilus sp.]|uniref:S41 family peptidase n=1 Tax=Sodaliphilus sp. TaxID=2815818 RepID=UPI00388E2861